MTIQVAHTVLELNKLLETTRERGERIAFVPTMGALHQGHLLLVAEAHKHADVVVVSIFVNPKQFGAGEDFERYPRNLEADVLTLEGKADIVFAPSVDEVYPATGIPHFSAGRVGELFEGEARPGHFDGMLTVVARLFDLIKPDVAVFGQKDAQQVFLVGKLIHEQGLPLELVIVPTVRESDGLALSSRNVYLSELERKAARVLSQALNTIVHAKNAANVSQLRSLGIRECEQQPLVRLEYLELVDPLTFQPVPENYRGPATAIIAAKLGTTRLIDTENLEIVHE